MRKKKIDLGLIILLIAFLVGIFSRMRITTILENFLLALIEPTTFRLVGSILLIYILGNLLNEGGNLRNINSSLEALIKDRRATLVIPSSLIGLLPVVGGAMLSAPIVGESGDKMKLTAEEKTFLNYWFRHIWEYVWPLYPGIILTSAIFDIPLQRIIIALLPLTLAAILSGCIFGLRRIPYKSFSGSGKKERKVIREIYSFLLNAWPILAIVFFVLLLKLDLLLSLLIIVFLVPITTKMKKEEMLVIVKNSLSWRIVLLIVSIMIFKRVLEHSNLLLRIPDIFNQLGISPLIALFSIPFLTGFLTGITQAFVGITFPILLPFIGIDNPNLTYLMLAYAGGFAGVLFSPVHLCLVITRNYFEADLSRVYKLLLLPILFVVLIAFMIVFFQRFLGYSW